MRRFRSHLCLLVLLAAAPLAACGPDQADRGLAVPNESATPDSPAADAETTAQRQQQVTDEMQKQQEKEFDAAAGGEKPAP